MCWDPSGEYLASVSEDSVRVWTLGTGSEGECVHELSCNGNKFHSCVFHPTYSSLLVIGCYQASLCLLFISFPFECLELRIFGVDLIYNLQVNFFARKVKKGTDLIFKSFWIYVTCVFRNPLIMWLDFSGFCFFFFRITKYFSYRSFFAHKYINLFEFVMMWLLLVL